SVSQQPDKYVGFGAESSVKNEGAPDCRVSSTQTLAPKAIYAPDPEYSEQGRKKKINGTVELSLLVGVDGRPHDIKVEKKLGYGLDEKAVEAIALWRFQPATEDGRPFETRINVSMEFKLY